MTERVASPLPCPGCGTLFPPSLLACPACGKLVHSGRLSALAAEANAATQRGDRTQALGLWREALELLPPHSAQYQSISARITAITREIDAGAPRGAPGGAPRGALGGGPGETPQGAALRESKAGKPRWDSIAAVGILLVSILSKGKLLLTGLKALPVLLTMLASIGVYWTLWNWKFAVGLVLCIYVHEMGHVYQLKRYGMKATAPMFIPGLGALIRLQQRPNDRREDGRIGLAGPEWGLAATVGCLIFYLAGVGPFFGALAEVSAWLNLFNLTPFGSLDGGRAFNALTRMQRWIALGVVLATYGATVGLGHGEGLLILVALAGGFRALFDQPSPEGHRDVFGRYLVLVMALTAVTLIRVPLPR